jgi:hypothetical protein
MNWQIVAISAALLTVPMSVQAQPSGGTALVENQASYLTRCRNDIIARFPNVRAQADSICQSNWMQIVEAGEMADTILTAAPRQGVRFDPAAMRTVLASVRWSARPEQGTVVSGRLGDLYVAVTRLPSPGVTVHWFKEGEPIPFNLDEALRVRGAVLTMIACLSFGSSEDMRVFRVTAAGKNPFALTISRREAALASQSSDFSVSTDFSGSMPSLTDLRRDGGEWQPACPQ